jgi:hypothetical protein
MPEFLESLQKQLFLPFVCQVVENTKALKVVHVKMLFSGKEHYCLLFDLGKFSEF